MEEMRNHINSLTGSVAACRRGICCCCCCCRSVSVIISIAVCCLSLLTRVPTPHAPYSPPFPFLRGCRSCRGWSRRPTCQLLGSVLSPGRC